MKRRLPERLAQVFHRLFGPKGRPVQALSAAAPVRSAQPCASVVIPALNEERRIADVVSYAWGDAATAEVIVIDDGSIDETVDRAQRAGARVVTSTMLGKGPSMRDGCEEAQRELVVYLDGDLAGLRPGIISDLCRPLVHDTADFVKARFGRGGGRVTELTAKPMLKVFFPELTSFDQPLGGIVAVRRRLLRELHFEDGYGVDIGLLIDAHRAGARLIEVDIGSLEHESQPLCDLTFMANEVARVIYSRARAAGRLQPDQIVAMYEAQRQAASNLDSVLTRRRDRRRLLLLDMDGTVTTSRFAVELARVTGQGESLESLLDDVSGDIATRSQKVARLFRFVHREQFERVARSLTLRSGVVDLVKSARRLGFMVGLVSDSYFIAAEIVRRRVFADFALAHTLQFEGEVCTGQLRLNPAFLPRHSGEELALCKSNVLQRFRDDETEPALEECWAVGDNLNDLELLRSADRGFVIDPKSPELRRVSGVREIESFVELGELMSTEPREASAESLPG